MNKREKLLELAASVRGEYKAYVEGDVCLNDVVYTLVENQGIILTHLAELEDTEDET